MALTIIVQVMLTLVLITKPTVSNNVIVHGGNSQQLATPKPEAQIKVVPTSIPMEEKHHEKTNHPAKQIKTKTRVTTSIVDRPTRRSRRPVAPVTKRTPGQTTTSATTEQTPKFERATLSPNKTATDNQSAPSEISSSGSVGGRTFGYGSGNYANSGGNYGSYGSGASTQMYGGGASGGNLMYFSNFDTALTTLAFLSFGVFLLNMIFSFLNMNNNSTAPGTPIGGGGRSDYLTNATQREKRELLSAPILLAMSVIQHDELFDSFLGKFGEKIKSIPTAGHCRLFTFCSIQMNPMYRQQLNEIISSIITRSETRKKNASKSLREQNIERFRRAKSMLESGTCLKILDKCSDVLNSSTTKSPS